MIFCPNYYKKIWRVSNLENSQAFFFILENFDSWEFSSIFSFSRMLDSQELKKFKKFSITNHDWRYLFYTIFPPQWTILAFRWHFCTRRWKFLKWPKFSQICSWDHSVGQCDHFNHWLLMKISWKMTLNIRGLMYFFKNHWFTMKMALTANLKSCLEGLGSTRLNQTRFPGKEKCSNYHLVWVSCGAERGLGFTALKRDKNEYWFFKHGTSRQDFRFEVRAIFIVN